MLDSWNLSDKVIKDRSKTLNPVKFNQFVDYINNVKGKVVDGYDAMEKRVKLSYLDVEYDCQVSIIPDFYKIEIELYDNYEKFLTIHLQEKVSDLRTRGVNFPILPGMSKLETVMKLKEKIYCFFHIEDTYMNDAATVLCGNKNQYNLILYRILCTDRPLDEISLYKKFGFDYRKKLTQHEEMKKLLKKVRQTPVRELAFLFTEKEYHDKFESDETIESFFSQTCKMNQNCEQCSELIETIQENIFYAYTEIMYDIENLINYCRFLIQTEPCE